MNPCSRLRICRSAVAALGALLLLTSSNLLAQVTFTLTGTAWVYQAGLGYTDSQPVTFNFVMGNTPASAQGTGSDNLWMGSSNPSEVVFTSVSLTGLTGTFQQPSPQLTAVEVTSSFPSSRLVLTAQSNPASFGLVAPDGIHQITQIGFGGDLPVAFNFTSGGVDPSNFFAPFYGTYTPSNYNSYVKVLGDINPYSFVINSVTISAASSAVPEPSTYAFLLGLGALGCAACRRFRM